MIISTSDNTFLWVNPKPLNIGIPKCKIKDCTKCDPINIKLYNWSIEWNPDSLPNYIKLKAFIAKTDGRHDERTNIIWSKQLPLVMLGNTLGNIKSNLALSFVPYNSPKISRIITDTNLTNAIDNLLELFTTMNPPLICNLCYVPTINHNNREHINCNSCEKTLLYGYHHNEVYFPDNTSMYLCNTCEYSGIRWPDISSAISLCTSCSTWLHIEFLGDPIQYRDIPDVFICDDCREDIVMWCDSGNHYVPGNEFNTENDYESLCNTCRGNRDALINYWNYRPALNYHPTIPTNPKKPLYIGLELEISWPNDNSHKWLTKIKNEYTDLLYVKSDSSVNCGFEVVTHPMEPDWALENFPFDLFQEAINLGAIPDHNSCGTHIHLSKEAFSSSHLWKFINLHFKYKEFCGIVGERGTHNTYACWDKTKLIQQHLVNIAKLKKYGFSAERFVPVNVLNDTTIEMRYMAGNIHPETIKKNIQWAKVLFEFSNLITYKDIKNGIFNNPDPLINWIVNKPENKELCSFLQKTAVI